MEFNLLHADIECNCIDGAAEDKVSHFIRTIDGNNARIQDFYSHWERYKKQGRELPEEDCAKICGLKGISINKLDGYDENEILETYITRLRFLPQGRKKSILKFTMGSNCGAVKHTPDVNHSSHHDLYKCDDFNINAVVAISVLKPDLGEDVDS